MADLIQIFASGLTGAGLNQVWTEVRARLSERKDAGVTAILLAEELDAYVDLCAARRQDIKNSDSSGGEMGRAWRTIPDPPAFSDKTNWRALGLDLTQKVLRIRAVVLSRNRELEAIYDLVDSENAVEAASRCCVQTGCEASELARLLRSRHNVNLAPDIGDQWNAADYLAAEWAEIVALNQEAKERAAKRANKSDSLIV